GLRYAGAHVQSQRLQAARDDTGGAHLLKGQLWMLVQVAAHGNHIGQQFINVGFQAISFGHEGLLVLHEAETAISRRSVGFPGIVAQWQPHARLFPSLPSGMLLVCSQERRWPAARESDRHRVRDGSGKMAVWSLLVPALMRFHSPGPAAWPSPAYASGLF